MASYANRAPRWITIIITVVLIAIGALGTFGPLPDKFGAAMCVAALVVIMLGVFLPGL